MHKETPASRLAVRMQIVVGAMMLVMFIGFPIVVVLEAMGNKVPGALFGVVAVLYLLGIIWMYRVKCPDCGAPISSFSMFFSNPVKSHCVRCNRSTSLPYSRDD